MREHLLLVHEVSVRKRGRTLEHPEVLENIGNMIVIRKPPPPLEHRQTKFWNNPEQTRIDTTTIDTVCSAVRNKLSLMNVKSTMHDIYSIVDRYLPDNQDLPHLLFTDMRSRHTHARAIPCIADSLDMNLKQIISNSRVDGSFMGLGFETDESPPAGKQFAGLRFQITIAYAAFIPPASEWGKSEWVAKAPIEIRKLLCDIVNAPAKDGATVAKIVSLQLERLGCSLLDVVSGSSDGGGENEGRKFGVHATLEESSPLYIRRRGLEHLAWNFCGAGLAAAEPMSKNIKLLSSYLNDGITWTKLKQIAVNPVANGGSIHSRFRLGLGSGPLALGSGSPPNSNHHSPWKGHSASTPRVWASVFMPMWV